MIEQINNEINIDFFYFFKLIFIIQNLLEDNFGDETEFSLTSSAVPKLLAYKKYPMSL
jgi:hypothetical protein